MVMASSASAPAAATGEAGTGASAPDGDGGVVQAAAPKASEPAFSRPLPLTRPPVIIGLLLAIVLFGVGIWVAATTDIKARVEGNGMVISGGSFIPIVTGVEGQIVGNPLPAGTAVVQGQQVAEVAQANGARTPVLAPADGTLLAVLAVAGEVVTPGQPIGQMANTAAPLQVTAFYSIADAAKIRVGMPAQVSTADSNVNSSSSTDATVSSIASYVATDGVISTLVGGDALVDYVTRDGPVVVVSLAFPGSPTDPKDLQWSGQRPPNFGNGSVVTTAVVTGEQTVLSLVRSS